LEFDLSQLTPADKAALAKAQAHGVNAVGKDGSVVDVSSQTPRLPVEPAKEVPAANASGDVQLTTSNAQASEPTSGTKVERPANVPEKFWDDTTGTVNTEALLKSYGELERARSAARPQEIPQASPMGQQSSPTSPQPPATGTSEADAAVAQAAQEAASAKLVADRQAASNDANTDIQRDGKISDSTYARLENVGYPRAQVEQYVSGLQAQATLQLNAMYDTAGGKGEFDKMVAWGANGGYNADEAKAFDAALRSGDKGQQQLAVNGLKSRYAAEFGKGKTTVVNTNGGTTANHNAFRSQFELMEAMQDKRYKNGDAAFHAEVAQRIAASHRANIDIGIRVM
jgi:hypothetical protein